MKKLSKKFREHSWNIGFVEESVGQLLSSDRLFEIKWVKNPYRDRWFADPFILRSDDNTIVLLVEEFCYHRRIGRIARLEIDRNNMMITNFRIILEKDTHLSFPLIIRNGGNVLVVPENYQSGVQTVYRLNDSETELEPIIEGSEGLFTDAVVFEANGELQMITTEEPDANGKKLDYYSLDHDFRINSQKPSFHFNSKTARNGGSFLRIGKKQYRPAQICDRVYGEGIEIQEIKMKEGFISGFIPVKRFMPSSHRWSLGLHTFNQAPDDDNLIVLDGHGFRYYYLGRTIEAIASIKRYITR